MVMNKRAQFGAENIDFTKVIIVIVLLGLIAWAYIVSINRTSNSAAAVAGQIPDDVSLIATFCKGAAESGNNLASAPYCIQARQVRYGDGLFSFGSAKQFVNCPYAEKMKWFTSTVADPKKKLDCGTPTVAIDDWAEAQCKSIKTKEGAKYKDSVVVNGKTCKDRTVLADPKPVASTDAKTAPTGKVPTTDLEAVSLGYESLTDYEEKKALT